jgi:hypothetical protein
MGGGGSKDGGPKKSTRPVQNFRLLLLGSGGSGKSTVFKQMRIQKGVVSFPQNPPVFVVRVCTCLPCVTCVCVCVCVFEGGWGMGGGGLDALVLTHLRLILRVFQMTSGNF